MSLINPRKNRLDDRVRVTQVYILDITSQANSTKGIYELKLFGKCQPAVQRFPPQVILSNADLSDPTNYRF